MKKLLYRLMCKFCWLLEDIHDLFNEDKTSFYPSAKWENLLEEFKYEEERRKE